MLRFVFCSFVLAFVTNGQMAKAQDQVDPGIRDLISAFAKVIENPGEDVKGFVAKHGVPDQQKQLEMDISRIRPLVSDAGEISVSLEGPTTGKLEFGFDDGSSKSVDFTLTTGNPVKMHSIKLVENGKRQDEATKITVDNLEQELANATDDWFSGVIIVIKDGKPLFEKAYGFSNREKKIANTTNTVFAIGSAPIDFTWVSILILKDRGKLSLDDKIGKYFDNVPEDKSSITIAHLMSGKSGLPDFHDLPQDKNKDHTWIDRDEAVRRILNQKLLFAPGTDQRHSHSAWGLLAAVVEMVCGQSYQEFTKENLYEPVGMESTGFFGDNVSPDRIAVGYGVLKSSEPNSPPHWGKTSWLVMGSGGQVSSMPDMIKWKKAIRQGKLLSPESQKHFMTDKDMMAADGDMFGFEFMHSRDPKCMFLMISNGIDSQQKRKAFANLGRRLYQFVKAEQNSTAFSLGVMLEMGGSGSPTINEVVHGGAADKAGLKKGDQIVSINAKPMDDDPMSLLKPFLQSGEQFDLEIERDGKRITLAVKPLPKNE